VAADDGRAVFAAFNPHGHFVTAALPPPPAGASWRLAADTARPPPDDVFEDPAPLPPFTPSYDMAGKAGLLLVADGPPPPPARAGAGGGAAAGAPAPPAAAPAA